VSVRRCGDPAFFPLGRARSQPALGGAPLALRAMSRVPRICGVLAPKVCRSLSETSAGGTGHLVGKGSDAPRGAASKPGTGCGREGRIGLLRARTYRFSRRAHRARPWGVLVTGNEEKAELLDEAKHLSRYVRTVGRVAHELGELLLATVGPQTSRFDDHAGHISLLARMFTSAGPISDEDELGLGAIPLSVSSHAEEVASCPAK
jgi:hypothetical protein